jgi:hypothetical protein
MAGETLPTGSTNTQGLADWAAPYITNYLGKAQALSETPYQAYQGPLTAGASNLQNKVFSGLAGLTFPSNLGQSFASPMGQPQQGGFGPQVQQPPMGDIGGGMVGTMGGTGAYDPATGEYDLGTARGMPPMGSMPPMGDIGGGGDVSGTMENLPKITFGGRFDAIAGRAPQGGIAGLQPPQTSQQPSNIAQSYMNPYLQNVLTPQLDELRRQNEITNAATNAKMTQAGGFGGGRQAIMNAENNRNLMMEQNKTVGQGYSSAYDKAMQQFNTEQGQSKDLANLMSTQGGIERGIESEGIAADLGEFEKQRQFPYQQVQFQRDMISGLPTGSVQNTPGQLSGVGSLLSALGGGAAAAKAFGYKDVSELLKGLGLSTGSSS